MELTVVLQIAAFSIVLGYQPEEIEDILKKIDFNNIFRSY
ncbi:hypothetical protein RAMDARK_1858 [Rickettsia amblyommatis str. Darkwater]|uniref:Uncharacterized protein n=2 Tax=Rickettsia amblyommatis TaxID=33989 RepID=H8K3R3_RICAG|nr:hypothetical protein MCE_00575 [Rickettsia amblyommatis str. GAT-30V]KJV61353.1 hypothetical protein APHACPA_0358 [Rickettsia amblyommatis str. Ac/Pa]KJV97787.1 hypothetical protein RAMDARK_0138 [Rickettsia amblyommatis str. Darkwater]KJV99044.1 hypothetical protein RAMDARK_1858 [Rickettsia amblyommatis str. Darkwater]